MAIAYVDAFSGASGDMLLGALLDAGLALEELQEALGRLGLTGYRLSAERQTRHGITGTQFHVSDESGDRPARHLSAIADIIQQAGLEPSVAERSLAVFRAIARAEAEVHGTSVDEVHFHEIGAVDSLVDIVGFCWGLHRLGIERLYCSPLPLGSGTVQTEHGLLPVPVPATLELLAAAGAPIVPTDALGELVTPTGAGLLATCATFARPPMTIERVGYGFGSKEFPWANMLRLWVGQPLLTAWVPGAGTHTSPQREAGGGEAPGQALDADSAHPHTKPAEAHGPAAAESSGHAHTHPHPHPHEGHAH